MRSILLQFSNSRWWPRSTSRTTGRRLEKLLLFVPLSVTGYLRELRVGDNKLTVRSLINVIVLALALRDRTETEEEGNQNSTSDDIFHQQPALAIGLLSQEQVEQCRCR